MKIHSIKFNFLMNAATTALNFLFPLITFPYVSRVLEPAGYGAAEFALSTAQLFSLVALLGVNTYGIRECAKVRDDAEGQARVFQELALIVTLWTVIVTAAYYLVIPVVPRLSASAELFAAAGLLIPLTTIGFQWFMSANEQYAFMAVRNLVVKILVVAAMFCFVRTTNDVVWWVVISVAATGLMNIANCVYIARNIKLVRWSTLRLRRHMGPLLIFFLMVASTTIYTMLDAVMLGFMTTDADVGYYNVAIKIKNVLISIIGALAAVLIPRAVYHLSKQDDGRYYQIVNMSVRAAMIYSLFVVADGLLYADEIIGILAGGSYGDSVLALRAVMPAVIFISFTQVTLSEILTPKNREKALLASYMAAGIVDILLNLLLIPPLHALGAAIATTVAEGVVFVAHVGVVKSMGPLMPYVKGCGRLLPCIILSLVALLVGRLLFGPGLGSFIGVTVGGAAVMMLGLCVVREPLMLDLIATAKKIVRRSAQNG